MKINNKEEFENFYPYDKKYINEYPREYPCIVRCIFIDGGLMGDSKEIQVAYYPKKVECSDIFQEGLFYDWIDLK